MTERVAISEKLIEVQGKFIESLELELKASKAKLEEIFAKENKK